MKWEQDLKKDTFILIDGNSLMYRAFYALPLLSNNKGIYTNAVYGFLNMLFKLIEDYQPTHLCVAFDAYGPTFRHEIFEEYKGKRQKTPEELVPQFALMKEILALMTIHCCEQATIEADDLIGTLAKKADENTYTTYIVTGDKDSFQLIDHHTTVLFTKKGISHVEKYDLAKLNEEYGLDTDQFIDLKGLMGDPSDNIPGVPGVGQKTALKLLHEYGSFDQIYQNIDQIKGRLKEKLSENHELAKMSRELATINRDVDMQETVETLRYENKQDIALAGKLNELGLNKIAQRLALPEVEKIKVEEKSEIVDIKDDEILTKLQKAIQEKQQLALCINEKLSFSTDANTIYCIETVRQLMSEGLTIDHVLASLKPMLEDENIAKTVHDQHQVAEFLSQFDIQIDGIERDTLIGAYLLDATRSTYKLTDLIEKYNDINTEEPHSAHVFALSENIDQQIKQIEMDDLYFNLEMPLSKTLRDMEHNGFTIDTAVIDELDVLFSNQITVCQTDIYAQAGHEFNINSPQQLAVILFEELGLPPSKKTKTGYSTGIEVLEGLVAIHPIISSIMQYRQMAKLKATYIDGLRSKIRKDDGKIHTLFNQTIAATGRISSVDPNLQNIPVRTEEGRKIRKAFIASPNHVLIDADYSQIELRVLAHISGDENFIQAFVNDEDIHRQTASEILGVPMDEITSEQRSTAKAVNFGIVYGISDFGLSQNLGITRKQAKQYIDGYFERYPAIKQYMAESVEQAKADGFVKTLLGRRRYLPELQSRNYNTRMFGERIAMNMPIQGTAADIIKVAMINVHNRLIQENMQAKLILQVHDELIVDAPIQECEKAQAILLEEMQKAMRLDVPLKVDIANGNSWYETK
jgi:DNA polymerase-1